MAYRDVVFGGSRALMMAAKSAAAAKPSGITKVVAVSPQLASFLGESHFSRSGAVKKVWEHIKAHNLQNPANKKEIHCDEKLKGIFNGKETVGFLEIAKLLSQHFPKSS